MQSEITLKKRKIFEKSEELAKIKSRYNLDESDLADMLQMHEDKISAFNISLKYNLNGSSEVYTILKKANKVLGNIEEKRDFISEKEIENRMNFYTMNITFGYEIKDIAECANLDEKTVKSKITFAKKLKRTIEELRENDYSDEDIINKFNEKGIELTSSIMKKIKSKEDRGQADR